MPSSSRCAEAPRPSRPAKEAKAWMARLSAYRVPSTWRSLFELAVTFGPFVVAWTLLAIAVHFDQLWLYALLLLPAGGLLVRLFMIQHDCGHGSFLRRR